MEPLTAILAAAVGTILLEKTGEKVVDVVWDKTPKFMASLKQESPDTVRAIERVAEQPLDCGEAELVEVVQKVESLAAANPDVALSMRQLAVAAEANPNPKLAEVLQRITETFKSQQQPMPKLEKLAEKIGQVVMSGGTGIIEHQSF